MIEGRSPRMKIYPLLESCPGSAQLVFPEHRFRVHERMEFVNADFNTVDENLSRTFTSALKQAGFRFPARLAAGKGTILKPFDEGYFVVDADDAVFHIKRVLGKPVCVKTPIPKGLGIRTIRVSENRRKEFYGMLLTNKDELFLISYDNYRLIPLPTPGYDPDAMDIKLIVNPLYRTVVYSNDKTVYATAMDPDYQTIASYKRDMPSSRETLAQRIFRALFPFSIQTKDHTSGYAAFDLLVNGRMGLIGIAVSVLIYLLISAPRIGLKATCPDLAVIALTGVYGLIAALIVGPETCP